MNNNVKVLFSDDLKKGRHDLNEDDIAANKLIIWDESHFAEAKKNRPAQWLSRNGLCKLVYNQACSFREGDGFLLTISATPFAQLYNLQKDNETSTADGDETQEEDENGSDDDFDQDDFDLKQNQFNTSSKFGTCVVVADKKAAPSYYGVADYIHRNQIHGIKQGDKAFRDLFEKQIQESKGSKKYAIIRVNGRSCNKKRIILEIAKKEDIPVKYYINQHHEEANFSYKNFKQQPAEFTIVFVYGLLRMGHVLCKDHLSWVAQTAEHPTATAVLQGLLGRLCGHQPPHQDWSTFKIYVAEGVLDEIKLYAETGVKSVLTSNHVKRTRATMRKYRALKGIMLTPGDYANDDDDDDDRDNYDDTTNLNNLELQNLRDFAQTNEIKNVKKEESVYKQKILKTLLKQKHFIEKMCSNDPDFVKELTTGIEKQLNNEKEGRTPKVRMYNATEITYASDQKNLISSCSKNKEFFKSNWYNSDGVVITLVYENWQWRGDFDAGTLLITPCIRYGQEYKPEVKDISFMETDEKEIWNRNRTDCNQTPVEKPTPPTPVEKPSPDVTQSPPYTPGNTTTPTKKRKERPSDEIEEDLLPDPASNTSSVPEECSTSLQFLEKYLRTTVKHVENERNNGISTSPHQIRNLTMLKKHLEDEHKLNNFQQFKNKIKSWFQDSNTVDLQVIHATNDKLVTAFHRNFNMYPVTYPTTGKRRKTMSGYHVFAIVISGK